MIQMRLFDAALYEEKRVLTSQSIQECYALVKRKSHTDELMKDNLCLVSVAETGVIVAKTGVIVAKTGVIAAETYENKPLMPQRKEKKRIEN